MNNIKKLLDFIRKQDRRFVAMAVVVLFGAAGLVAINISNAATFSVVLEAESGTSAGNIGAGATDGASALQSVKFGSTGTTPNPTPNPGKIYMGAAIRPEYLDNAKYAETLVKYKFDSLTAENDMKFNRLEPNRGQFTWEGSDKLVAFAQANNMRVRGHTLVWHVEAPNWVNSLSGTEASAALENHIKTVVGRYKGKIAQWDVVNEALNDDGTLRDTIWRQKIGDDYVAKAFQWAREADPNVELYYNEYGAESRELDGDGNTARAVKSDAVLAMVKDFKARGIPIDGVGHQTHSSGPYPGRGPAIEANIRRLAEAGVKSEITELDAVDIGDDTGQANRYKEIAEACKNSGACTGVTTWGLDDGTSWLGADRRPLMFDTSYNPKPSYTALIQVLGK